MTYFILCVVVAVFVFCCGLFFHYIGKHPEAMEDDPKPVLQVGYDSYEIQSLINERWRIQAAIRNCSTLKDMGRLYWEIEELEDWYKDRVPDQLLIVHADELFAYHTQRALELRNICFS